jgi:hypothetical protein
MIMNNNLLNPPVQDGQKVWTFKEDTPKTTELTIYPHIWDETQELEFNPDFWFASEEDCFTYLRKTPTLEIYKLLNSK